MGIICSKSLNDLVSIVGSTKGWFFPLNQLFRKMFIRKIVACICLILFKSEPTGKNSPWALRHPGRMIQPRLYGDTWFQESSALFVVGWKRTVQSWKIIIHAKIFYLWTVHLQFFRTVDGRPLNSFEPSTDGCSIIRFRVPSIFTEYLQFDS